MGQLSTGGCEPLKRIGRGRLRGILLAWAFTAPCLFRPDEDCHREALGVIRKSVEPMTDVLAKAEYRSHVLEVLSIKAFRRLLGS